MKPPPETLERPQVAEPSNEDEDARATEIRMYNEEYHLALPGEMAVAEAARRSLDGHSRGLRRVWPFLGPAFIAAVAYIDPGNFATNIAGGAQFGYLLLWVVLGANLIAMVVQTLSAKLGIATGKNLAELCRESFSRPMSIFLWLQAELVAMATDIAEVVGAALGLYLLFGIPCSRRAASPGSEPSPCWRSSRRATGGSRPASPCSSGSSSRPSSSSCSMRSPTGPRWPSTW